MKRVEGGFTLIEVLVATTILGLTLTAIFAQMSVSLRGISRVEAAHVLTRHARSKLAEVKLVEALPADQEAAGRFADGAEWRVQTSFFAGDRESASEHIVKISVTVRRDGAEMTFHTYRFQEAPPPEGARLADQLDVVALD